MLGGVPGVDRVAEDHEPAEAQVVLAAEPEGADRIAGTEQERAGRRHFEDTAEGREQWTLLRAIIGGEAR